MTAGRRRILRWRLEAAAVRVLFALFGALPVDWASALGGGLARLVGPHLKISAVARRNLARIFPDMTPRRLGRGGQIPKGAQGARLALEVLRQGGHLGMLIDQKMNDGIAVPFFGRPAMTAPAVSRLAVRFRCPVVPAKVERLGGAHFRMTFYPPLPIPDSGNGHRDTLDLLTALNALVEQWVRANPGQWLWLHKRWPE